MKPFSLSLSAIVSRFFLMMGVIIAAGFSGMWWLSILALPIFLSALMGVKFGGEKKEEKRKDAKMATLEQKRQAV
ncbi:MAG: hypothetical protein GYB31_02230 [Bacteroidetes bacterium]|nr:hypothetical protein [Bacteroidota bacterium]